MPLDWLCGDSPSEVHDKERTDTSSDKGGRGLERAAHVMPHTSSAADGPGRLANGGLGDGGDCDGVSAAKSDGRREREARGVAGKRRCSPAGWDAVPSEPRNKGRRGRSGWGPRQTKVPRPPAAKAADNAALPTSFQCRGACASQRPRSALAGFPCATAPPWKGKDNRFITGTILAHDVITREQRLIAWAQQASDQAMVRDEEEDAGQGRQARLIVVGNEYGMVQDQSVASWLSSPSIGQQDGCHNGHEK